MALVQIIDAAQASAAARAGAWLVCHAGCSPCCHGVFEVSALDGERLRVGLAAAVPEVRERVLARVALAQLKLGPFYPGDLTTGVLRDDEEAVELFEEWAHADACPVLDPATQTCDLYAHRPILCRTFGPPIRNDHEDAAAGLAICELCFDGASKGAVAAAEMDSSWRDLQHAQEAAFDSAHPELGPTMIPFCFQQIIGV